LRTWGRWPARPWPTSALNVVELAGKEADAMRFLDRLLGRGKTVAGDTDHNSVKGEGMHEDQEDAKKGMLTGPPSEDIDPQFIKDTERKTH
jgi:hypothetical protein